MASTSTTTTTTTTKKTTMQQSFILVDESGSMSGQKTSSVLEGDAKKLRELVAKMTKMAMESAKMISSLNVVSSNAATTINDIDQADAAIEKISNSQQVVTDEVAQIKQALLDIESEAAELEKKIGSSGKLSAIYKSVESVEADINKGEKYLDDCDKERTKIKQKMKTLATIRKGLEVADKKTEEVKQKIKRLQKDYEKARDHWKSSSKPKSTTAAFRIATSKLFSARSQLNTVGMKIHREQKKLRKNLKQLEESEGQNIALEKRIAKSLDTLDAYLNQIR